MTVDFDVVNFVNKDVADRTVKAKVIHLMKIIKIISVELLLSYLQKYFSDMFLLYPEAFRTSL